MVQLRRKQEDSPRGGGEKKQSYLAEVKLQVTAWFRRYEELEDEFDTVEELLAGLETDLWSKVIEPQLKESFNNGKRYGYARNSTSRS